MAQPIYSTSVLIDEFKGLNQNGSGSNMSMRFAAEMENVNVHNGEFSQMREGLRLEQELLKPIGTLAYLSRRFVTNPDTLLIAISDGKVYTKELDGDDAWVKRYPKTVNTAAEGAEPVYAEVGTPLTVNDCDWLTYESNIYPMYSASRGYALGERCMHEYQPEPDPPPLKAVGLYSCKTTKTKGEEWNPNRWTKQNIYRTESGTYTNEVPMYSSDATYTKGTYCARDASGDTGTPTYDYKIYKCTTAIMEAEEWTAGHWSLIYSVNDYSDQTAYRAGDRCVLEVYGDIVMPPVEYRPYRCTTAITTPEEWTAAHWTEVSSADPVDVLLFTNATDGMYCLYGDTLEVAPVMITPDPENNPTENIKFGVIARYNERIWGSGIAGDPDKLMYSVPYNPFDWTANFDIPEDGAGDISQPTWDGDSFISLHQFGSDLLAIKRNSIWRIYGTHPGEFAVVRQYGGGTIQENTVAVQDQYMYMLGEHGLMRYDGIGAYAFLQDVVQRLMQENLNRAALDKSCAAMRNGTYCVALPVNGSQYCNAILEYNPSEGAFALRTDITVDSFLQINERLFYTSATEPGVVFELQDLVGMPLPCKWISGYQDLGLKNSIKSAFILYMMVKSEAPVELRVGIRTEKKFKQKIIYTKPGKMSRLHLNTQGREFRLEILSYSAIPFTIAGGIRLDLELDPD